MATDDEQFSCYNRGCNKNFILEENSDSSCVFHPGGPIFHEGLKGWSCCKKRVTDFTEFLNMKGCTTGFHNPIKPKEPEKEEKPKTQEIQIQPQQHRKPNQPPPERPPDDEPLVPLKCTVGASLKSQLEKLSLKDAEDSTENSAADGEVKIGTSCHNKGCKASYEGEHSNLETCIFHSGVPIFHEGMKYWTCCQRKTSDFENFLNQEGCVSGQHNWIKPKVSEEKQVRTDWHQTPGTVCISIFAKVAMPEKTVVLANRVRCQVDVLYDGGKSRFSKSFTLRQVIDPSKSEVKLLGTKVEINMKKGSAFAWPSLELPPPETSS